MRDRRTTSREEIVALFATRTPKDARRPAACATSRALPSAQLLSGLLLLSRP
ncbi:MAG: hypothetical protein M9883_08065 [Methylobacteriaceae bacterium]|nr:hypothetical protein [Methylobacteriaceae bacterium]